MSVHDGARVIYQGTSTEGLSGGETGYVLMADDLNAHVQWDTGHRTGKVDLVRQADLGGGPATPPVDDRVAAYVANSIAVADLGTTFDLEGADAVLAQLGDDGRLSSLDSIAEEVAEWVAGRVRVLEVVREVSPMLGDGTDDLVDAATRLVLRSALQEMEENE